MKTPQPEGATSFHPLDHEGLIPNVQSREELNEFEFQNIASGEAWAWKSRKLKKDLISVNNLCALHKKMFGATWRWAGSTRVRATNIGLPHQQVKEAFHALCGNVKFWIEHNTYPKDEIAIRFHQQLTHIHPFPNGNGRFARLAADLLVEQLGEKRFTWGTRLADIDGTSRSNYLSALKKADGGEFGDLIKFARR